MIFKDFFVLFVFPRPLVGISRNGKLFGSRKYAINEADLDGLVARGTWDSEVNIRG